MLFIPKNQTDFFRDIFSKEIKKQGLEIIGWRKVPVISSFLGEIASISEPVSEQVFIKKPENTSEKKFKIKLYIARKIAEHKIYN